MKLSSAQPKKSSLLAFFFSSLSLWLWRVPLTALALWHQTHKLNKKNIYKRRKQLKSIHTQKGKLTFNKRTENRIGLDCIEKCFYFKKRMRMLLCVKYQWHLTCSILSDEVIEMNVVYVHTERREKRNIQVKSLERADSLLFLFLGRCGSCPPSFSAFFFLLFIKT